MRRLTPLICIALLSCGGASDPQKGGGTAQDGADAGDGADGSDGADGGDGDDGGELAPLLAGSIAVPAGATDPGPVSVALLPLRFGEGPAVGQALVSTGIGGGGTWTMQLPSRPPDSDLAPLERDGPTGAIYALIVFSGDDGEDRPWTEGHSTLLGAAMSSLILWQEQAIPGAGPAGWSQVDIGLAGRYDEGRRCLLDTDLPLNWRAEEGYPSFFDIGRPVPIPMPGTQAPLRLSGDLLDLDPQADAVAGIYYRSLEGEAGLGAAFDVGVNSAGAFSAEISDAPPEAAYLGADPDWRYAAAFVLPYIDLDGDGAWQDEDPPLNHTVCIDGDYAVLRYTEPVDSWRGYRFLDCYGGRAGWSLATAAADGTWTTWHDAVEATNLEGAADSCPLWEPSR